MSVQQHVRDLAISAKQASQLVANSPVSVRNAALEAIAGTIQSQRQSLLDANTIDLSAARDARLDAALIDRLELTETRVDGMLESLAIVQALSDPIGGIEGLKSMESGIQVGKMRVPLGLIAVSYTHLRAHET